MKLCCEATLNSLLPTSRALIVVKDTTILCVTPIFRTKFHQELCNCKLLLQLCYCNITTYSVICIAVLWTIVAWVTFLLRKFMHKYSFTRSALLAWWRLGIMFVEQRSWHRRELVSVFVSFYLSRKNVRPIFFLCQHLSDKNWETMKMKSSFFFWLRRIAATLCSRMSSSH